MKKIATMIILAVFGITVTFAQKPAEIVFDKQKHTVIADSKKEAATCVYQYTNIGEQPLSIMSAIPSGKGVVVEYGDKPIGQGENGAIKVTYDFKNYPTIDDTAFMITVRTNGKIEKTKLWLYIKIAK